MEIATRMTQKKETHKNKEMEVQKSQDSLCEHRGERWKSFTVLETYSIDSLREPCFVSWVTRTVGANGCVSSMLPPFLAVVAEWVPLCGIWSMRFVVVPWDTINKPVIIVKDVDPNFVMETQTCMPLMSQGSFKEHLDGRAASLEMCSVVGLRKPCIVTFLTRASDANSRVSPILPPFLDKSYQIPMSCQCKCLSTFWPLEELS